MAAEPGSECADVDMSKDSVKRDKKKKKEEETEMKGQEQPSDTTVEHLTAERDEVEGKQSTKPKKSKRKRGDAAEASPSDQAVTGQDKKRKKEHPVAVEESGQEQQTLDSTVENLAAKRDEDEGKQSSKSKKSKGKRNDAGDQGVTREDNKKKKKEHPSVLEKSSQPKNANKGENGEIKERGKEGSKSSPESSENASAGGEEADVDGKNDKKKKKSKEGTTQEGIKEKEKAAQSKNKGKRVSVADSTEVFETQGDGGEGTEGGKYNNKKKAAQSKNKGKRVSVADSTEVFETQGDDGEGTEGGNNNNKKKAAQSKNKGKRVSFADFTEVFETQGGGCERTEGGKNNNKKKAAQSKNKGKRVSFTDSTEVFETEDVDGEGTERGKKKGKKAAQSMNKGKRVSFADSAEVFETEGGDDEEAGSSDESEFLHGLRFTEEEDATLMEAIVDFIEMKQLGDKGLEMFRTPRKHKELRHCWDVIGKSLPHRPYNAIYRRARILLSKSDKRGWTKKEKDYIRSYVQKNGTEWKKLAHELGKCDIHVKDTWRRIKSENLNKGYWTQDEHQMLFDLVNLDLRMKAHQIKNPDNRKLRDNISWEAISDKLSTRNHKNCCLKWYDTLASPLVRKRVWADLDDYLLVEALQKDDAICIEDVDWDSLLDHRSGQVCRQRWNQMVRGLGGHREKPFIEQVDVLSKRYCPEMIEYRKDNEETPAGDANGDKKKRKSKESEEPGVASAEVKKEKKKKNKKSKESEEAGSANAEVEKEKKKKNKSKESEEPGAANAEVEKEKKKKNKKSKESEEPGAANAEVEKEKKKKKNKSKESEEPGAANAEVEKDKKKKKNKSKESEEPGAANAEVKKEKNKKKKKSKESEEPGAANAEVEKENNKKKTDT